MCIHIHKCTKFYPLMFVDEHVYVQGTNKYLLMIHIFNVYVSTCMHILYSQNYWLTLYDDLH